jgi:5-methyltetrahydrofolate--homocysteine methyltransferase
MIGEHMTQTSTKQNALMERLRSGGVLISDGATGTYQQTHGLEPGGCPEELNASRPELIKQMYKEFFDAGSDMVLTASFGGNRFMLEKYGHGDRVTELNRLAAQHAKSVAPPNGLVAGSVGPSGEFLEPLGEVTNKEMLEAFAEQVTALADGGADVIVVETMMAIEEATLAVRAVKENTDLPVIATMTFDKGPRGFFTMMGVTPERAVTELREAGADVTGANCGNGIDNMVEIAQIMRGATDGYLLVHSNAGIPVIRQGQIVYTETPEYMAERFKDLADLGINILGGCCGTTPDHIRALSQTIRGE